MEFKAIIDAKARNEAGCAVVGVYEDGDLGKAADQLDKQMGGLIGKLHADGDFSGKLGDVLLLPAPAGAAAARVLLVGLGARASFGRRQYRRALQSTVQALAKTGARDAVVYLALEQAGDLDVEYRARNVAEVFCAQLYKIPDLKTGAKPKTPRLSSVGVAVADARAYKAAAQGLRIGAALGSGLALSRDLANLPPNVCTPAYLGTRAQGLSKDFPSIKTRVLDESAIKALKMGAFLAVAQGSDQPPRLIVCEYHGGKKRAPPICLVGKGITFDSGGISLKDPPAMDEMKFDMSGAAAVLGTLRADRRAEIAGQSRGHRRHLREYAERRRGQARGHRHEHVRPNGRDPQYRRRRTADPLRRHHLQPPLQAGRGDRRGDAHRRLHHCARQPFQRLDEQ